MTEVVVFVALFGAGSLLILTAQPHGAGRPSLARQLSALRPQPAIDRVRPRERVFRTRAFEENVRPALEKTGESMATILGRLGLDFGGTDERLRAAGDRGG